MTSQNSKFSWEKDTWTIIEKLLSSEGYLVRHQLDSFNEFLDMGLSNIISSYNPIRLDYEYVADQIYYRLAPTANIHNKIDFESIKEWTEFRGDYSIFQEELHKIVANLMKVDQNQKLSAWVWGEV